MTQLLLVAYIIVSFIWTAICIDRGRILPKTVGDFIMTLICSPIIAMFIFAFALVKPLFILIEYLLKQKATQKIVDKLIEGWNKEL